MKEEVLKSSAVEEIPCQYKKAERNTFPVVHAISPCKGVCFALEKVIPVQCCQRFLRNDPPLTISIYANKM